MIVYENGSEEHRILKNKNKKVKESKGKRNPLTDEKKLIERDFK